MRGARIESSRTCYTAPMSPTAHAGLDEPSPGGLGKRDLLSTLLVATARLAWAVANAGAVLTVWGRSSSRRRSWGRSIARSLRAIGRSRRHAASWPQSPS